MRKLAVFFVLTLFGILVFLVFERIFLGSFISDTHAQKDKRCFMNFSQEDERSPDALDYSRRQIYGFEEELSLTEAVRIFNEELKCNPQAVNPLTEDEVVASILAGSDYGRQDVIEHQYGDLLKIATEKRMPKGSLFVFEGDSSSNGAFIRGDIFIKGQRLYLFLGLDKAPRTSEPLKSFQVYLIRKGFVSSHNTVIDRTQ